MNVFPQGPKSDAIRAYELRQAHEIRVYRASQMYERLATAVFTTPGVILASSGHKDVSSKQHANDMAYAESNLALLAEKEKYGQTHEIVSQSYKQDGTLMNKDVFVATPLADMKAEQLVILDNLKQTPPDDYATPISGFHIFGGLMIVLGSMVIRHDIINRPIRKLAESLGEKHVQAVYDIKKMFKSNKQDAAPDQSANNNQAPKPDKHSTPNIG